MPKVSKFLGEAGEVQKVVRLGLAWLKRWI